MLQWNISWLRVLTAVQGRSSRHLARLVWPLTPLASASLEPSFCNGKNKNNLKIGTSHGVMCTGRLPSRFFSATQQHDWKTFGSISNILAKWNYVVFIVIERRQKTRTGIKQVNLRQFHLHLCEAAGNVKFVSW